jgi:type IV secretory pathway VirD2 relaxase
MNNIANETLAGLLQGRINPTKGRLDQVKRIVNYTPEVVVKITGFSKGDSHMAAHLDYVSRKGDIDLEDERGNIVSGKEDVRDVAKEWGVDSGRRKKGTRDTVNVVLSMPGDVPTTDLKDAARAFAQKKFSDNHQYVMALHQDTDNPHVHLTIKSLGYNGKRLHIKRGDPHKWREMFAKELQHRGVEAEATSRAVRGVVMKDLPQSFVHMMRRGVTPANEQKRVREILDSVAAGNFGQTEKPWETKIRDRQNNVRKTWLKAAKELSGSEKVEEKLLSDQIFRFVSNMPSIDTKNHQLAKKMSSKIQNHQAESQKNEGDYER